MAMVITAKPSHWLSFGHSQALTMSRVSFRGYMDTRRVNVGQFSDSSEEIVCVIVIYSQ